MSTLFGFGIGIASLNKQDQMLDTLFPAPLAHVSTDQSAQLLAALKAAKIDYNGGNAAIRINVQECRALAQALAYLLCYRCLHPRMGYIIMYSRC